MEGWRLVEAEQQLFSSHNPLQLARALTTAPPTASPSPGVVRGDEGPGVVRGNEGPGVVRGHVGPDLS